LKSYYFFGLIGGTLCSIFAIPIGLLLGQFEPIVPLLVGGSALLRLSFNWKQLIIHSNLIVTRAEKVFSATVKVLMASVVVNFGTAILATVLRTGFSIWYAIAMFSGVFLAFSGAVMGAVGAYFRRHNNP
jgi:hypothetical protein